MYLKSLILTGFKSFPEKIRLEFVPGVTAVVGPNGSGKSNISDAVRWVLGEQSARSLRGSKMEDVIFAGTEHRRSLGFTEVSIVLDNADRTIDSDYTDIVVTRRMYRSGEGEYKLNGETCRLKDIHELFMDTGIGREGYSIIGQGKIDEILSARGEDRRNIFEEAAGIVKYKSRKQEASNRLEREKVNLRRVEDIIEELSGRVELLAEQAEKAKKYLDLREQLKIVTINSFMIQADAGKAGISEFGENIRVLSAQLDSEQARQNHLSDTRQRLGEEIAEAEGSLALYNNDKDLLNHEAEDISIGIRVTEEHIKNMLADERRLANEISDHVHHAEELKTELAAQQVQECEWKEELFERMEQLTASQKEFDDFSASLRESDKAYEEINSALMEFVRQSAEVKGQINRLEDSIEMSGERRGLLEDELRICTTDIEAKTTEFDKAQEALTDTNSRLEFLLKRIKTLESNRDKLQEEVERLGVLASSKAKKLNEAESRLKALSELDKDFEGYKRGVRAVLKNREHLPGAVGAVGELITMKKEHEVAIATALGSSVQDIVTLTEKDALAAIEFLKKNNEGLATFLPLNAVTPRAVNKDKRNIFAESGILGLAKDLVTYDKKLENVFAYLLGGMIVATDAKTALAMFRKYKTVPIVTLEGEMFHTGGSISGGRGGNGKSDILSRTREMRELKERVCAFTAESGKIDKELDEIKQRIKAEAERVVSLRGEWQSLLMDKSNKANIASSLQAAIAELLKKQANIQAEVDIHLARENDALARIEPLRAALAGLDSKIEEAHRQRGQYQSNMSEERDMRDGFARSLTDLKVLISGLEQRIINTVDNVKKLERDIIKSAAEKERCERGIVLSLAEREGKQRAIQSREEALAKVKERALGLLDSILALTGKLDSLRTKQTELESRLRQVSETINQLNGNIAMLNVKKEHLESENRRLYDEIWDEYRVTPQTAREIKKLDMTASQLKRDERRLKQEITETGDVNVGAIDEYKATNERFQFLKSQREDILAAHEKLNAVIADLTELMTRRFREQFEIISTSFNIVFGEMFVGGTAKLILDDEGDILETGIEIVAQPPGKNLQSMSLLSGGERALTAAALLFAILRVKPSPFCILDEIEAALDEANVARFADYIRRVSASTQFILITHRKGTMYAADVLYGVTMQEVGVSKLISVKLDEEIGA
ncbi:MAG: chromosome segregation protein SMC [Clostridiales bacterium]|jgi:chromosome segregation protein|nr:chromosome segregation protein SMC [Clostridiales bacterium]